MTSDGLEQGISSLVYQVLQETSQHAMPRQRLQRVVLAAMAELAHDFDPFKDLLRAQQGVPLLLSFLSPKHDEYLIKETLQLLGRMTQSSTGIQQELQRYEAINAYSGLDASALHDAAPASPQVLCANALGPRENATRALWHLSSTPDNQLMIAREGALPALVANLSADSDRAKEFAAAAMESLSRDCPENQVRTRTLARFTRD